MSELHRIVHVANIAGTQNLRIDNAEKSRQGRIVIQRIFGLVGKKLLRNIINHRKYGTTAALKKREQVNSETRSLVWHTQRSVENVLSWSITSRQLELLELEPS